MNTNQRGAASQRRDPSELTVNGGRLPHIVLFGGQDAPSTTRLLRRWCAAGVPLPSHELTVAAWPAIGSSATSAAPIVTVVRPSVRRTLSAPLTPRSRGAFDRAAARFVSTVIAGLEARMRCDPGGVPQDLPSRAVYHYTRFSVDALYDRDAHGTNLIATALTALRARPVDLVIAHSFGGTLALRAAWELCRSNANTPRFSLITLGTACGPMVVRSPMFANIERDGELIAFPPTLRSWQHFYSEADAFVAAPALPKRFARVESQCVDSGSFLGKGRGHALVQYLRAPEVQGAIGARLAECCAPDPSGAADSGVPVARAFSSCDNPAADGRAATAVAFRAGGDARSTLFAIDSQPTGTSGSSNARP